MDLNQAQQRTSQNSLKIKIMHENVNRPAILCSQNFFDALSINTFLI